MKAKKTIKKGVVRIIAGEWKGRRLPVVAVPGLRPSGDRLRETLFNWLQQELPGSHCLDLFAGTGVLGLEAASRGAVRVELVEWHRKVAASLRQVVDGLGDARVSVLEADAMAYIAGNCEMAFDLVFVDPPFDQQCQQEVLEGLCLGGWVKPGGLVYVESSVRGVVPVAPEGWEMVREKNMGEVRMQIIKAGVL